jgi:hypothetical protein
MVTGSRSTPLTAVRVAVVAIVWPAVVVLAGPRLGLYYETLAAWAVVPPLGLLYAYRASHRSRATVLLAILATAAAVIVIAFAVVIPKATAA